MKTFILCGGFGTRLKTAVSEVPKPLAPVCGEPFLKHLIKNCISQGAADFCFLIFHEAEKIESMLSEMKKNNDLKGIKVRCVLEDKPLGTGGALLNAINELNLKESFLAINADTWLGTGLQLINKAKAPALATVKVENTQRYGNLRVNSNLVQQFEEKNSTKGEGLINAGLYHLLPESFSGISVGSSFSLEKEVLPQLAKENSLYAVDLNTDFIDIGIPEDYYRFCNWIESGKKIKL